MPRLTGDRLWADGWSVVWFALGYAVLQQVGLALLLEPTNFAMWWPASGLALAVLIMNPRRRWPQLVAVIVAVNLAGNLVEGALPRIAVAFALSNAIGPLLGALLVLAFLGRVPRPDDGRDVVVLMGLGAGVAPLAGSLIVASALTINFSQVTFVGTFVNYWSSDFAGAVVMAPAVLALGPWRVRAPRRSRLEMVLAVSAPGLVAAVVFSLNMTQVTGLHFFILAALLWPAMRFGITQSALSLVPAALAVSIGTYLGRGPFATNIDVPANAGRVTQVFIAVLGIVALIVSVVPTAQRRVAMARTARVRQQAELRRSEKLHQLSSALAGATSLSEVAGIIAARAAAPVRAVAAELAVVSDSETLVAQGLGAPTSVVPLLEPVANGAEAALGRVIRTDEAVEVLPDEIGPGSSAGYRRAIHPIHDSHGAVLGALGFYWDHADEAPGERQLVQVIVDLAGQSLDRAKRTEREHALAETLQMGLLPSMLPDHPQLAAAARYLPGTEGLLVGGDWYDMVRLADGGVLIVVGDVAGHGEEAAITMGRLRTVVQADAEMSTAQLFDRLNRVCVHGGDLATALAVRMDPWTGRAEVVSAGHPPAVVAPSGGSPYFLDVPPNGPLGVNGQATFRSVEVEVPLGSLLVLYTDGLVERRTESIDKGLDRLLDSVAMAAVDCPEDPSVVADRIVGAVLSPVRADDVALFVCALHDHSDELSVRMPAEPPSVPIIRQHLRHWMQRQQVNEEQTFDLLVAAGEAVANAAMHAYPAGMCGMVELTASRRGDRIELVVIDNGSWRPPRQDAGGRGLKILRTLGPVQIVSRPDGTTVTITFDLNTRTGAIA
jgi:integral membrane sensor domain MASE1/anti-sigma regulatory factor (Ser/Thr protein kinase)